MSWNIKIEISDPQIYLKHTPSIIKHINHAQDYKIQWRLAQLKNFDLLSVIWESGSTYTEGYTPLGKIVFTFFDGDNLFKVGQEEVIFNQKHLLISQPGIEGIRLAHQPYSAISIYVDAAHFLTELSKYLDQQIDSVDALRGNGPKVVQIIDRTSNYGRSLYQMVITLCHLIETNGHSLVISNLESAIFSSLVQGVSCQKTESAPSKISEASIDRVRETAAYIRANLKQDITIAKIAAEMKCSSRAIQAAFARHYGTSPSQFLRIARLEAAYTELIHTNKTVTEVALEYGFENLGRFAKYFQQHFGKKPSDILRK